MLAAMSRREFTHIKVLGSLENVSSFLSDMLLVRYCISHTFPVFINNVPDFPCYCCSFPILRNPPFFRILISPCLWFSSLVTAYLKLLDSRNFLEFIEHFHLFIDCIYCFTWYVHVNRQWVIMHNGIVNLPVSFPGAVLAMAGIDSGSNQRPYGAFPANNSSINVYNSVSKDEWGYLIVIGC